MCNVMVSYFQGNYKVQRNKTQSRSEQADPSRSQQADHSMIREIRVEHIRYGSNRLYQTELRGMIRLEQSRVKASGENTRQIGAEQENHREREEPFQNRKEKCSQKIRVESEKISVGQSGASSD